MTREQAKQELYERIVFIALTVKGLRYTEMEAVFSVYIKKCLDLGAGQEEIDKVISEAFNATVLDK